MKKMGKSISRIGIFESLRIIGCSVFIFGAVVLIIIASTPSDFAWFGAIFMIVGILFIIVAYQKRRKSSIGSSSSIKANIEPDNKNRCAHCDHFIESNSDTCSNCGVKV